MPLAFVHGKRATWLHERTARGIDIGHIFSPTARGRAASVDVGSLGSLPLPGAWTYMCSSPDPVEVKVRFVLRPSAESAAACPNLPAPPTGLSFVACCGAIQAGEELFLEADDEGNEEPYILLASRDLQGYPTPLMPVAPAGRCCCTRSYRGGATPGAPPDRPGEEEAQQG
jgi:hypothetical protein